ncbi:unnamed protein product [Boreogadus saida]
MGVGGDDVGAEEQRGSQGRPKHLREVEDHHRATPSPCGGCGGGPEDPSEARVDPGGGPGSPAGSRDTDGADRGLGSSGGVERSDHSSPRISSSCRTRLTTCSTADFDALYEELQQLGQGGFGSVFAGCRKEDRLPVAIKHIPVAKVSMTQETVEGRLTDFPLEVSLMLRAAEDRPDPGGPGAVVHSRNKSKKLRGALGLPPEIVRRALSSGGRHSCRDPELSTRRII